MQGALPKRPRFVLGFREVRSVATDLAGVREARNFVPMSAGFGDIWLSDS